MKKPTTNDTTRHKGDLAKWDYILADEVNRLFPKAELDKMAEELGLDLCYFRGDCDHCQGRFNWDTKKTEDFRRLVPIGRTWARILRGEETETDYYICDACLPLQWLDQSRHSGHWDKPTPCLCRDTTGTFRVELSEWGDCSACFGIGERFAAARPWEDYARALQNGLHAMHRSEVTKGRRQRYWRNRARHWHKLATRKAGSVKQYVPPPRSVGKCNGCKKTVRRPFIAGRYLDVCDPCATANLIAWTVTEHAQE